MTKNEQYRKIVHVLLVVLERDRKIDLQRDRERERERQRQRQRLRHRTNEQQLFTLVALRDMRMLFCCSVSFTPLLPPRSFPGCPLMCFFVRCLFFLCLCRPGTMALVHVTYVNVLNNPSRFSDPFQFEITFECHAPLQDGTR